MGTYAKHLNLCEMEGVFQLCTHMQPMAPETPLVIQDVFLQLEDSIQKLQNLHALRVVMLALPDNLGALSWSQKALDANV